MVAMADYVSNFRSLPTDTLKERLNCERLSKQAADAYRQILTERASYVPVNLSGEIEVSGHSGCYYACMDRGQSLPKVFDSQMDDDFLISGDLVRKHDLHDGDKIVFQLAPDMVWVSMIVSVG